MTLERINKNYYSMIQGRKTQMDTNMHNVEKVLERKCLIIGANGGLGRVLMKRLIEEHYTVIATYHKSKEHIDLYSDRIISLHYYDLLDSDTLEREDIFFDGISDVIFAAGKESLKSILDCSYDDMIEQYNINVFSPLIIIQKVLKSCGSTLKNILFISSSAANDLNPYNGMYALSKASLCDLTKMLDSDLSSRGIRVNCIVPGWCETEMAIRASRVNGKGIVEIKASKIENRLVQAEDIAEICTFLLSNCANNIHGQFIGVDVPNKRL